MKRNGISVEKKYVGRKEEIAGNRKIEKPSLSILSNCLSAHGIIVDVLLKISKRRLHYFKKKRKKRSFSFDSYFAFLSQTFNETTMSL